MSSDYRSFDDLPLTLRVEELMPILGIGRNTAYELVRSGKIRGIRVETLNTHTIQGFYNRLTTETPKRGQKTGLSPKTVKNVHGVLHKALQHGTAEPGLLAEGHEPFHIEIRGNAVFLDDGFAHGGSLWLTMLFPGYCIHRGPSVKGKAKRRLYFT